MSAKSINVILLSATMLIMTLQRVEMNPLATRRAGMRLINGFFAFNALYAAALGDPHNLGHLAWWILLWTSVIIRKGYLSNFWVRFLLAAVVCATAPLIVDLAERVICALGSSAILVTTPLFLIAALYSIFRIIQAIPSYCWNEGVTPEARQQKYAEALRLARFDGRAGDAF